MNDCLFCKIAKGEIPSDIVYSDELVVAFNDISPKAPVHILIVPRIHLSGIDAYTEADAKLLSRIFYVSNELAKKNGLEKSGYRIITNNGKDAGQTVLHLHFHLLGGQNLGELVD